VFATLCHRLPRLGRVPRLCAIGICLLLALDRAATGAAARDRPTAGASAPVVVAVRTLPVGHVLARGDLRVVAWPRALRPASARGDPRPLLGRRLSGSVGRGEPVTDARLVGPELASGLPDGLVAAAVPLPDPHAVDLVRPGDRVDLLASPRTDGVDPSTGSVTTVARGVRTLAVFAAGSDAAAELVVAVPRDIAVAITRAGTSRLFTAVVIAP